MPTSQQFCFTALAGSALAALFFIVGCQEPNYRNEVSATPQGGVEVHRVAKDPFPESPPPASGAAAAQESAVDLRITALEAQVRALSAEVAQLKAQKSTTTP
jgi:hypothetical protein